MSNKVNPPEQLRVPPLENKNLFFFLKNLLFIVFQLWKRTGGGEDFIASLEVRVEKNEQDIIKIKEDVIDLQLRVAALEYRAYENVSTTTSLTTNEFQIILCKNTSPIEITLKTDPIDGDEISVIRTNATVKVIGSINEKSNLTLNVKGSGPKFVYDADSLTWWKI